MKAFAKLGREPGEAGIREIDRPEPGLEEVLIRVAACGVCGSDLHAYRSDPGYEFVEPPTVLGHEFAGTVEEVGDGVEGVGPGDRVVAIAIQGCGRCETCRLGSTHLCPRRRVVGLNHDGGMSEHVVVAERHLIRVPDGLDLEIAALAEPLSVAVHAVLARARIQPGHTVVVTGPGPIGLLCGMMAGLSGGEVLVAGTGTDAAVRLPAAERLGLRTANLEHGPLDEHLLKNFGESAPDSWVEASGAVEALEGALGAVRRGGTITGRGHVLAATLLLSHGSCPLGVGPAVQLRVQLSRLQDRPGPVGSREGGLGAAGPAVPAGGGPRGLQCGG
ncbi:MAG: alcohol dehydrogenase catalytic domain-containing protein [Rubrobacter sp.]